MSDETGFGIPLLNDWVRRYNPDQSLVRVLEAAWSRPFNGAFSTSSLLYGIAAVAPELLGSVSSSLPPTPESGPGHMIQPIRISHNTVDALQKTAEVSQAFGRPAPTPTDLLAALLAPPAPHGEETSARKYLRGKGLLSPASDALLSWVARSEPAYSNAMRGFLAVGVLPPIPKSTNPQAPTIETPASASHSESEPESATEQKPPEPQQQTTNAPATGPETIEKSIRARIPYEPPAKPELPDVDMLDDSPSASDYLDFEPYADAIAQLIQRPNTKTPFTIAISAPWGAGKSTLGKMIESRVTGIRKAAGRPPYVICWFNAWMHDEAPSLAAAFATEVMRAANGARPWWVRLVNPLPASLWKPEHRKLFNGIVGGIAVMSALAIVISLLSGVLDPNVGWLKTFLQIPDDQFKEWVKSIRAQSTGIGTISLAISLATVALNRALSISKTVGEFVLDPKKTAGEGAMTEVRDQIGEVVAQASHESFWLKFFARFNPDLVAEREQRKRRIVIFIDDVERCKPPRSLEVLEVMNQLLCHENIVCIVLADLPSIQAAAGLKYKDLAEVLPVDDPAAVSRKLQFFGRNYLQKIVQLQFEIPPSPPEQLRTMLNKATEVVQIDKAAEERKNVEARVARIDAITRTISVWCWIISAVSFFALLITKAAWLGTVSPLAFIVASSLGAKSGKQEYRSLLLNQGATTAAKKAAATGAAAEQVVEAAAKALRSPNKMIEAPLIAQQAAKEAIFSNTKALVRATAEAFKAPPPLPRNAKRMTNGLRLLIYIATQRKLFERTDLTPEHVGKWADIRELWPDLSARLLTNTHLTARLEAAAERSQGDLEDELEDEKIEVQHADELQKALGREPMLAPILPILLYLEPTA